MTVMFELGAYDERLCFTYAILPLYGEHMLLGPRHPPRWDCEDRRAIHGPGADCLCRCHQSIKDQAPTEPEKPEPRGILPRPRR